MFLDNEIKSTPSRNIRSRKDRSILDPKQQHQVARLCMIPFQNACTIGPESFVYNCWTNPKNFFASKHTSVQGFGSGSGRRYFAYLCHKIPFAASSFAGAVVEKALKLPALPKFAVVSLEPFESYAYMMSRVLTADFEAFW